MIPLAFSTNAFGRFPLEQAVADIAAAGYAGVELLVDQPHIWPLKFSQGDAVRLRGQLDTAGLEISNLNANCTFGYFESPPPEPFFEPSLVSPDPRMRGDRMAFIELTLEIAAWLGARNISITSGRLLIPPDEAWATLIENLKRVCDRAEAVGVRVGIETEPALFIETSEELAEVIARVGSPMLGANLDLGHVYVMGESPAQAVSTLDGRIWNVHIEDLPAGRRRKHYHMIPGTGGYDFMAAHHALASAGYDRFATVELYTCAADPAGAARSAIGPLVAAGFTRR